MEHQIGKYEIQAELGRGGFGRVYRAYDPSIGRSVAIKLLAIGSDPDGLARFRAEATLTGKLQHKNIVTVYEVGEYNGSPYIVMELVDGETLESIAKKSGTMSLVEKLRIMCQVAEALEYAHSRGVVHRDVKPANIMVLPNGLVKVMDFGIARMVDSERTRQTRAGDLVGTISYMAPEQFRGADADAQTDLFAYGVVSYELFGGVHPFSANDLSATLFMVMSTEPPPLREIVPDCPEPLQVLVMKALAKERADRYQSFEYLLFDAEPIVLNLRRKQAAKLMTEVSSVLREGDLGAVLPKTKAALELDPSNQDARLIVEKLQIERDLQGAPLVNPTQPDSPESVRAGDESVEPTRIFRPPLLERPGSAAPLQPIAIPGEFTQMFSAPDTEGSGERISKAIVPDLPDVAITIVSCSDKMFEGQKRDIKSFPFRIGRGSADLHLPFDIAVSSEHAEIDFHDGDFILRDLRSANGTYVNGRRLNPGDATSLLFPAEIVLGANTQLRFISNDPEEIRDLTGTRIAGLYVLTEKLYSSAKSSVYVARHSTLPVKYAIKILSPRLARIPGYRERFESEAQVASELDHPYICRILDYGESRIGPAPVDESLYICMEFLSGGSLFSRIARAERFPVEQTAAWLDKLSDALDYIHSKHVIHGGLKPSSIMFDSRDAPHLTDFAVSGSSGAAHHRRCARVPLTGAV